MAHFVQIIDNVVMARAVVLNCVIGGCIGPDHWAYDENDHLECGTLDFPESEPLGQAFLKSIGEEGDWMQCSYNGTFRGINPPNGSTYDADADVFVPPVEPEPE